jgi:phospholipid/cholesterol/gamma-HCH transport system substrate-binding protein
MSTTMSRRVVAAVVAALLLAAGAVWVLRDGGERQVSAVFPSAVSLFEGSDVKIMGVRVGEVTEVTPRGTSVLVEMEYDGDHSLPADVQAVVVSPSVIGDRFVQLTPAYGGGEAMADGGTIPQARTAVPVELDDMVANTTDLAEALGPDGANRDGAVSRLLEVAAESLDGLGADLNSGLRDVARASDTVADASPGLRRTVGHAAGVTGELATYDAAVRRFNTRLSRVAGALAADRADLSTLLASLARSLGEVEAFVGDNRREVARTVGGLKDIGRRLRAEKRALAQIANLAPLGFTNLVETYDPDTASVRTRANFTEILRAADVAVCAELRKQAGGSTEQACGLISRALAGLPLPAMPGLPGGPPAPGARRDSPPQLLDVLPWREAWR